MAQQEKLELWGKSPSFRHCLERTKVVAATGAAVLLLGETGVGKEVMANFIHRNSGCKGPFVAIHPASIPENLFENELFGHEKGAFTGAVGQKSGLFELADNGTLFIDEVGDIPMNMQIKLLRVLQEHRFMRVGGTKEHQSSFRLITATTRDLLRAVREGSFREDLYYRISVVPIEIPPLRERIEDMEEFVIAFTSHFARRYGKKVPCPDAETFRRLSSYAWPGNFRELRNAVERAVIPHASGTAKAVYSIHPEQNGRPHQRRKRRRTDSRHEAVDPVPQTAPIRVPHQNHAGKRGLMRRAGKTRKRDGEIRSRIPFSCPPASGPPLS